MLATRSHTGHSPKVACGRPRRAVATDCRCATAALGQIVAAAGDARDNAPAGSYRAAQDQGLDLTVDYDALFANQSGDRGGAPPGSFRAAQDLPARVDWSRRVGKSWELDPVLLHRRQTGQPQRPGDDLSNKTIGIELRRRF